MLRPASHALPHFDGRSRFVSYTYAYPHKTAYRRLDAPVPLREAWRDEPRDALFLYLHVPFCEHRCGFCNLFTQAAPAAGLPAKYLDQLGREAQAVREALSDARFARLAIGGGTPTFLDPHELRRLFAIVTGIMGARPGRIPVSVEASPATVTPAKLALLRELGADRLSLGVETFDDGESAQLGRPQRRRDLDAALAAIREARFPTFNIDLIYGAQGQTIHSWLASVDAALEFAPHEIYLYPLYVRRLTGLGRLQRSWDDERPELYRAARELLVDRGYRQVSMRMFRLPAAHVDAGPVYCCQSDGMVGLGCGARSYTDGLHYSTEYAVDRSHVGAILGDYLSRQPDAFRSAWHGYRLDADDRRRRFVILSLLQCSGLERAAYRRRFFADVLEHLPQLATLEEQGLADISTDHVRLTDRGIEFSDAIGPWLYSSRVRELMETYECR